MGSRVSLSLISVLADLYAASLSQWKRKKAPHKILAPLHVGKLFAYIVATFVHLCFAKCPLLFLLTLPPLVELLLSTSSVDKPWQQDHTHL